MKHSPLKEQLSKEIHDFRESRNPRAPNKKSSLVRKLLYLLIGISTLAGLVKIMIVLLYELIWMNRWIWGK